MFQLQRLGGESLLQGFPVAEHFVVSSEISEACPQFEWVSVLGGNDVGDEGAGALGDALAENRALRDLSLGFNQLPQPTPF